MNRLIKTPDVHRTSFTRIHDAAIDELQSAQPDSIAIQAKLHIFQQKIDILVELYKKFVDAILDADSGDIDIDKEMEKADQYVMCFNNFKLRVQQLFSATSSEVITDQSKDKFGSDSRKIKLPTIELHEFGGDIQDWLNFWAQFKRIHEHKQLSNEDKFQYLLQATIPKSKARQVIDSYPPSGDNYPKAIESLKTRFGRDDLLVEVYVRELLKLILNNFHGKSKHHFLYDKLETQLRALETLGVTSDKCAAMLYPLIESCLPEEIIRVWQRSTHFSTMDPLKVRLDNLMMFLRNEVENKERIRLVTSSFDQPKVKRQEDSTTIPTASGLVSTHVPKCVFCKKNHLSVDCNESTDMGLEERKKILSQKGCCHLCLKFGHIARKCRSAVQLICKKCGEKHVTLMCPKTDTSKSTIDEIIRPSENLSNHTHTEVFLQTLVVQLQGEDIVKNVRAIIDTGSERSYINRFTAIDMKFKPIRSEDMIHALFGGYKSEAMSHNCYRVNFQSLDKKYSCSLEVLDQPMICTDVMSIQEGPWMEELVELGIQITDRKQGPIDILIGADVAGKLLSDFRYVLKCGLVAIKTSLGWSLMGKTEKFSKKSYFMLTTTLFSENLNISDLWNLDVLGITDVEEQKSTKEHEEAIMEYSLATVHTNSDGRYEVNMPWIEGHPPLSSNFHLAKTRLDSLVTKLNKDGYYQEYNNILQEWLSDGIIERIPDEEIDSKGYYLPHRHVVKLSSSTKKLRPVFDASATDAFLQAVRRFVACRGRPSTVYSDNGRTFVGAENAFSSLNWMDISNQHSTDRITWKFNPPFAVWWGGWWERLIRLIKQLLKKVLGKASLTFEELSTILCDCEAIVNSRPSTYISEDESDLVTLNPSMFLKDVTGSGVPDIDAIDARALRRRIRYKQKLREDLRKRFRKEYLGQLMIRKKKNSNRDPKVGEVVFIENDTSKRIHWPLARVEELIFGKDGKIRLVRLRCSTGVILRPLQRLYPLEMDISGRNLLKNTNDSKPHEERKETSDVSNEDEIRTTRYGRRIVPVSRLNV